MPSVKNPRVTIVGSLNLDHICRVEEFPCPGSTIAASDYIVARGGKGANQAIAAVRQGVDVSMVGAVGDDQPGRQYLSYLSEEEGVEISGISLTSKPTGCAFISVHETTGENTIVTAGGANETVSSSDIKAIAHTIEASSALLVQLEIPLHSVIEAIEIANKKDIPVIVNPSPMIPNFPWDDFSIPYVIVNQNEANELLGPDLNDYQYVRSELHERRIQNLILTRGSLPTLVYTRTDFFEVEPLPVLPIDTVGAGDAFAGCFAARIAEGKSVEDAVRAANCAGALTTLGGGAQRPIPDRERVEQHLEQIPKRKKIAKQVKH